MQVHHGLAPAHRETAAQLYWLAFGGKLGRVFGPQTRALAFLDRVLSPDHCLSVADDAGTLVAIAGFKSPNGSLAQGSPADLRAVYGWFGALWRRAVLRAMQTGVDNRRFLIDGICVAPDWQGKGIGRSLLAALEETARAKGYLELRLEVMANNPRARKLYETQGYTLLRRERRGLLLWATGIGAGFVMVRKLPPEN